MNNELINVKNEDGKLLVSLRELHEKLGIKTQFTRWAIRMFEYGFEENIDYIPVSQKRLTVQGNETTFTDYIVTIDMAKEICMIQRTPEGKQVRQYLIDLEKAWNTPEQVMARALKIANRTIDSLKAENVMLVERNNEMKPKAIFADAVATSRTSILIGDLAKLICQNGYQIGQKRLFEWLRNNGYLCKRKGTQWNMPTQKSMDLGLFEVKESVHVNSNGCNIVTRTPKATGKAQIYFVNKFLGSENF